MYTLVYAMYNEAFLCVLNCGRQTQNCEFTENRLITGFFKMV